MKWNFSSAEAEGYEKQNAHFDGHFIFPHFSSCYTPYGVGIPGYPADRKKKFYWCFTPFIALKVGAFVK
jgi:hypothetical protein